MNATAQRTHRTVTESLAARIETLETLTEQLAKNGDILHRQLRALQQQHVEALEHANQIAAQIRDFHEQHDVSERRLTHLERPRSFWNRK